jgi:CRP-like cAMP-binding protein
MARCLRSSSLPIGARAPVLKNHILIQLPASAREALLAEAEHVLVPAGRTFARAGEPISTAYFPESGLISSVSEMATGHQVAVAAIGTEGVLGIEPLLGIMRSPYRLAVLLESTGYRLPADHLRRAFQESEILRALTLAHVGRVLTETASFAACSRSHSHRQRLARWLLVATDKAEQRSLPVTHDVLAQMVGGPRHAVTVALNELRAKGAIARMRGRVDILDRSVLIAHSCECYRPRPRVNPIRSDLR